jgi:hypothetical protein
MDGSTCDHLAQTISSGSSRRRLLGGLTGLGLGGVLALLEMDDGAAEKPKDRLQRRTKQHRRKRRNEKHRTQDQHQSSNGGGNGNGNGGLGATNCTVCAKGCTFTSVQAALDAANAGDTVIVCPGNYTEDLTFTKNLTLRSLGKDNYPNIAGTKTSSVVTVNPNVTVTIQQIAFGLGIGTPYPERVGGGVFNQGTLTLSGATFGACTAELGGGIYNDQGATLFLTNSSTVYSNTATQRGGGLFNDGKGQVTIDSTSTLEGNQASEGGGLYNLGTALLRGGAAIVGNIATASGGGIYNKHDFTVDAAFVQTNTATDNGGGIMQDVGQTTLQNGAIIEKNSAKNGGGV